MSLSRDLPLTETAGLPAGAATGEAAAPAAPAAPLPATDAAADAAVTAVRGRRRWWRVALVALAVVAGLGLAFAGALVWLARAGDLPVAEVAPPAGGEPVPAKEIRRLEARLAKAGPRGAFIVIDTVNNRLQLVRGDEAVLDAPCSTGTGAVLADPASGRRWVFDTPKGAHRVQIKLRDPVWKKPDWAFIEEGQPVPAPTASERFDFEALGDYGLYFGDGFLIHGTLYQRLLGRSVTHGCIRLGDEALEELFRAAPIGTPIYIF
jgi:L,D-transpeptidase YbiS